MCFYHFKYGKDAKYCVEGCKFHDSYRQGTANQLNYQGGASH